MLVYISGKYSSASPEQVKRNIAVARSWAIQAWEAGHAVICPHLNTAHFEEDCEIGYDDYLTGDLAILARCDAIVMLPDWAASRGAVKEYDYAVSLKIPVYFQEIPPLHPTEVRSPVQARAFAELMGQMYRTHLSKNADYSPANILGTGYVGLVTRLWDKMARLMNLAGFRLTVTEAEWIAPKEPKNESVDDSLMDMAVYAIIGYLLRKNKWGK